MKLFQRLLVAPAALGLMAPVAVNADTAFSSTTTLSGGAYFAVGSVADGGTADTDDELHMQYAYGLDINSSFTGEDLLTTGIEAGNAEGPLASMDGASDAGSSLTVTSLYYAFPLGDLSVTAGPLLDQDDVVAATTSAYSDAFRLGSMPFSLQDSLTGPGIGIAYNADNGIVASASYVSLSGASAGTGLGINADNGDDVSTFTLGYNGEGFGGGIVIASNDGENAATTAYDTFGGGIYYSPESMPATFSVAYDTQDLNTGNDKTDFFVGVDYEVGPGTLHAAYNSTDVDGGSDDDQTGFEVAYSYAVNDSVTIKPGYFTIEETTAGKSDDSGVVLETTFSF